MAMKLANGEEVRSFSREEAATVFKKFYIVWNPAKNEGVITSSEEDMRFISTGRSTSMSRSSLGEAFRELYDWISTKRPEESREFPVTEIHLDPTV